MKLDDIGIIIGIQKLQEKLLLVKVLTENHGIYKGITKSPSPKNTANFQLANLVNINWQARLADHLGNIKCEQIKSYQQYLLFDKFKLYSFNSIAEQISFAFHEHEAHTEFYHFFLDYLEKQKNYNFNWLDYIKLELALLKATGFALDLSKCAVTHKSENLKYVSPKTGRAVSEEAAKGYEALLLPLPPCLVKEQPNFEISEINLSLKLTEYFLQRYLWSEKIHSSASQARNMLKSLLVVN